MTTVRIVHNQDAIVAEVREECADCWGLGCDRCDETGETRWIAACCKSCGAEFRACGECGAEECGCGSWCTC